MPRSAVRLPRPLRHSTLCLSVGVLTAADSFATGGDLQTAPYSRVRGRGGMLCLCVTAPLWCAARALRREWKCAVVRRLPGDLHPLQPLLWLDTSCDVYEGKAT